MPVIEFLDNILMQPLMVIYRHVLTWLSQWAYGLGWPLIFFSVVINLFLTPIYYQMERAGQGLAALRARVDAEVQRMKENFSGRELYFYIRTIHRHYGYRPSQALLGSSDLFLQILVFATVFRFLSNYQPLEGEGFYAIPDLSQPDGLIFGLNALPLLMTLANIGSVWLYSRDARQRKQGLAFAALFLILLYPSASGLVLYWTANNIFSLLRNFVGGWLSPRISDSARRRFAELATQE